MVFSLRQDKTDKAPVIDVMKAGYMKAGGVDCRLTVDCGQEVMIRAACDCS